MRVEAVFFDLGDTITDLGEGRGEYEARVLARSGRVYEVLAAAGLALPERATFCADLAQDVEARYQAALRAQAGLAVEGALSGYFSQLGWPVDDQLLQASAAAYSRSGGMPAPLRLGARETLAALHCRGIKLGVISNTIQPGRYLDASLREKGIVDFFAARIYSSEVGLAKPHAGIFRAALAALHVAPGRALMVGDRLSADIAGAQRLGMHAILIQVSQRREVDPLIVPDASIRELPELLQILC